MRKRNKLITICIVVFSVIFLTSIVYAASNGLLTLDGTSEFSPHTELNFVNYSIINPQTGEAVNTSFNKHTLSFSLVLAAPGDSRTIEFYIQNAGNQDAQLGTLSTIDPEANTGITVNWPSLNGVIVPVGELVGPYTIVTTWDTNYPGAISSVPFSATINYVQYE